MGSPTENAGICLHGGLSLKRLPDNASQTGIQRLIVAEISTPEGMVCLIGK